jgi:hypothetical protein
MAGGKKKFDMMEDEQNDYNNNNNDGPAYLNAEDINPRNKSQAQPLMPFLSEEICRALFSKNWSYRESAILEIGEQLQGGARSELLNFNDQTGLFVAVIGAISIGLEDKISKVGDAALSLIDILVKSLKISSVGGSPEFNNYIDKVLENLTLKIGDPKSLTKTLAEDGFYHLSDFRDVGVYKVSETLLRTVGVPKASNDNKHKKARLDLLARMVEDYGIEG